MTPLAGAIERDGFALLPDAIDRATVDSLLAALGEAPGRGAGLRNVSRDVTEIGAFAASPLLHGPVRSVLGGDPFVARVLLFDKTPGANWAVGWHQDPAIAVKERREAPGFGGWSVKAGVPHVHPPASVLEKMLTLRVHLDPCPEENGALRVLPGSHRDGRLNEAQIDRKRAAIPEFVCAMDIGGVLAMRPLLLHASSPSTVPGHRRVLHLEFANADLPGGLEWHERISVRTD